MKRWMIRIFYLIDRLMKGWKLTKVFWRKWMIHFIYRHTDVAPPPSMITLRVTNNCNLRCVQCGQWGQNGVYNHPHAGSHSRQLTTEEWKVFIDGMSSVCPHVYFFGGEPFLRKDLLELVKHATSKNIIAGVNTNGNFLKGKGAEIVNSGMDYIIVSLDGPEQINNQIRIGRRDGYRLVVEGVEELVLAKKELKSAYPLIEMNMTLTIENQTYIVETAEIAKNLGVNYFAIAWGIFTTEELARESSAQYKQDFGIEPEFFKGFVRDVSKMVPETIETQITEVKRMWGSRYKQYPPMKFSALEYFHRPEKTLNNKQCVVPWMSMQVMPNGDMAYCEDFPDLVAGNILNEDPLVLWNNEMSRSWRRRIRSKGIYPAESRCGDYYLRQ
jgi:MoaA/NifB/PqqE/SkfB family radical SAM enzyme